VEGLATKIPIIIFEISTKFQFPLGNGILDKLQMA
jgi:hypothetical protein